ncbi:reverse transcriptase domain-containing protein [Tanacetum coccineum]|uniref:Reverse transcriptase domain-containing protein n=1 Tax=Tanacetum coccineum TaxID=301880 RepID=A0ABQ5AEP2_9ASTR
MNSGEVMTSNREAKEDGQAPDRNKAHSRRSSKIGRITNHERRHTTCWHSNPIKNTEAEEDEEKIAFHTSQGVFYYTKMPFGLKNVGAKYQRLVDKAFKKQIAYSCHTDTIPKEAEGSAKPQWKASKLKQIPIRVSGKIATFLQNSKELHKEKWFPMDDGHRGSIPRNETVHHKTPNAYCSKAKRRADHVPLYGERSNQRSVNRKRLTANASLLCQPCTTNSGNQLQLNEKISTRSGAFDVNYRPRTSIYGQILADFIAERPEEDGPPLGIPVEEEIPEPFEFSASNNEAEYEALVAGLRIAEQMGPLQAEYVVREIHEGSCSMHSGPRFGLPGEIVSDNGKQFRDNPFKDQCDKLNIRKRCASVKHLQTNELVERANRSLGEGIKARLDAGSKNWIEEMSHVLWAHRTMIKTSNGDTPLSLTYSTEAVIPVEIV